MEIICKAFVLADIPLHKLRNSAIKSMFEQLGQTAPSESACRNYLPSLYELHLNTLCDTFRDQSMFFVADEWMEPNILIFW